MLIPFVAFLTACAVGCATSSAPKERSLSNAVAILQRKDIDDAIALVKAETDVDALRIVAVASQAASWPMYAGPNGKFDRNMDDLSFVAMDRLHYLGTEEALKSFDYSKRVFLLDGATSLLISDIESSPTQKDVEAPHSPVAPANDIR